MQLNEVFFFGSITGATLTCTVNSVVVGCTVVQKDLIKVDVVTYAAGVGNTLRIGLLERNYQVRLKDKENFLVRAFFIDPATKEIDYVSYTNTDPSLARALMTTIQSQQTSPLSKPSLLWHLTTPPTNLTYLPKIYVGYYSQPIPLIVYDSSKFLTTFTLTSTNYPLSNFTCEMGHG